MLKEAGAVLTMLDHVSSRSTISAFLVVVSSSDIASPPVSLEI
jgi:hypothetical protein